MLATPSAATWSCLRAPSDHLPQKNVSQHCTLYFATDVSLQVWHSHLVIPAALRVAVATRATVHTATLTTFEPATVMVEPGPRPLDSPVGAANVGVGVGVSFACAVHCSRLDAAGMRLCVLVQVESRVTWIRTMKTSCLTA